MSMHLWEIFDTCSQVILLNDFSSSSYQKPVGFCGHMPALRMIIITNLLRVYHMLTCYAL